jgi:hypothetical protein
VTKTTKKLSIVDTTLAQLQIMNLLCRILLVATRFKITSCQRGVDVGVEKAPFNLLSCSAR